MATEWILQFFLRLANASGTVLKDSSKPQGSQLGGEELLDLIDRFGRFLAQETDLRGKRLLALVDNSLETSLLVLACMRHGIALALAPATQNESETRRQLGILGSTTVIATSPLAPASIPRVEIGKINLQKPLTRNTFDDDAEFLITFTSGTTSDSKAVVHSARSILSCAQSFNARTLTGRRSTYLNVMPMSYMAGVFNCLLAPLSAQSRVIIHQNFSALTAMRFWQIVSEELATSVWLSPTMLKMVADLDRREGLPSSHRLKQLFVGTGPLGPDLAVQFTNKFGIAPIQSYGLSETLYVSVDDLDDLEFGSAGRPLDELKLELLSDGTLQIASPFLFKGYLDGGILKPHTGPFPTSDYGEITESGRLKLLGRADDVVIRGGMNINPHVVETAVAEGFPGLHFCVLGLPDPTLGEKLCIVFERRNANSIDVEGVKDLVKTVFVKIQLDQVYFVDHIPTGPTGKPKRSALRTELEKS